MAGKSKIAKGALEALTDAYKKTFAPETYYHSTPMGRLEGDKFDPNFFFEDDKRPIKKGGLGATYFTKDKDWANQVADFWKIQDPDSYWSEITTYPVKIKTKDLFDYKNKEHMDKYDKHMNSSHLAATIKGQVQVWRLRDYVLGGHPQVLENDLVQDAIKKLGFRGYKIDEPGSVGLFYPDKGDVRSIFAKFDPEKSKSGEILASVPIGALATGGALSQLVDEEEF
jgi:hypothetical protein